MVPASLDEVGPQAQMMQELVKGRPHCDYCQGRHPWPRHCRQCGAELQDRRTRYCGGFESPCGREWAFTHATWGVVREIILKERGPTCEVCGKDLKAYAYIGHPDLAEVHHLHEVDGLRGPGLQNRRTNLIVLCHDCHQLVHNPPQCRIFWISGRAYRWENRHKLRIPAEQLALL